ncbi:hypothetical protein WMF11_46365 [Sorangium sp. So ce295]|uniref:hypothetical protein n=1 Tax=Sorangium sp. So ce295 TaxID=3133295 RepID=UPI003F5DE1D0
MPTLDHVKATFAAFYPNCRGVFGLHDEDQGLLDAIAGVTYDVLGWYADPTQDCIATFLGSYATPPEQVLADFAERVGKRSRIAARGSGAQQAERVGPRAS